MTEQEWLACDDPKLMLEFLRGKASERKLLLFACGCQRRVWHLLEEASAQHRTVELLEVYLDGAIDRSRLHATLHGEVTGIGMAAILSRDAALSNARLRLVKAEQEQKEQTALLRDMIGNPFRPVAIDREWLTPNVLSLALKIYDERAFDRMAELADALEEAGCTNTDILAHCRGPGPHVRGCWVVDLLLGKE